MSESAQHRRLVERILGYIADNYASLDGLVVLDDRSGVRGEKPPAIDRYTPDVYAYDTPNSMTVIGEAKTVADLQTERSSRQLAAFFDFLKFRPNGCLLFAVPWGVSEEARTIITQSRIKASAEKVPGIILDGVPAQTSARDAQSC